MDNLLNYNITLVMENTISSQIWSEEIKDLKEKFISNFNNVKIYNIEKSEQLSIIDENMNSINIKDTLQKENNLIFFITDTTTKLWSSIQIQDLIKNLNDKAFISIINLLPNKMWSRTALSPISDLEVSLPENIQNNLEVITKLPFYMEKEDIKDYLILPTANINKVGQLLNSILDGGKINTTSIHMGKRSKYDFSPKENPMPIVDKQVLAYRMSSSQEAYTLAVLFSNVNSFTLSDINFVKEHMLPGTDKSIVAEMLMGTIVEKAVPLTDDRIEFEQNSTFGKGTENEMSLKMTYSGPKTIPTNPQEVEPRYKMKEGVGEMLIKSLRYSEEHAIKLLLKEKSNQDNRVQYDKEVEVQKKLKM